MEWFRDRALTLVLMAMFLVCLAAQLVTGLYEYNAIQREHGEPLVSMTGYLGTGHPWEALFENWESEFLQMAVFVLLTTWLVQKGSPESRRPGAKELVDIDPRDFAHDPEAPWPVRRGGWILRLYEHSLGLAFILLFLLSWIGHALGGFSDYAADEVPRQCRPSRMPVVSVAINTRRSPGPVSHGTHPISAGFKGPARDGRHVGHTEGHGSGWGYPGRDGGLVDSARISIPL